MILRLRSLPLVLALTSLAGAACGDGGTGGAGGGAGGGEAGGPPEGCTEITQASDGKTLFSIGAVGFEFTPASAGIAPEVVVVSPNAKGQVPLGTVELEGYAMGKAPMIVFAIEDAIVDLVNREPTAMDGRIFAGVGGTVDVDAAPTYGTQFQARVKATLSNVTFRELDDAFEVVPDGDCYWLRTGTVDAAGADSACEAPAEPPSNGACLSDYAELGHQCNPVTQEGCMAGEVCDYGGTGYQCYPDEGSTAALCGECDNAAEQLCAPGLTCDSYGGKGKCFRYCCTDGDCGAGGACVAHYALGAGVCLTL